MVLFEGSGLPKRAMYPGATMKKFRFLALVVFALLISGTTSVVGAEGMLKALV